MIVLGRASGLDEGRRGRERRLDSLRRPRSLGFWLSEGVVGHLELGQVAIAWLGALLGHLTE